MQERTLWVFVRLINGKYLPGKFNIFIALRILSRDSYIDGGMVKVATKFACVFYILNTTVP